MSDTRDPASLVDNSLVKSIADQLPRIPDEVFVAEFLAWWDEHGQLCRSGGGDYERTFAFEAWRYLYPRIAELMGVLEMAERSLKFEGRQDSTAYSVICTFLDSHRQQGNDQS